MALGAELVTDNGFDDPNAWAMDDEWSVAAGVASCVSGNTDFIEPDPAISIEAGHTYQLIYTIASYTGGTLRPFIGSTAGDGKGAGEGTGIYTEAITAADTGNLRFRGRRSFTGSIDDVSVKEMTGIGQGFVG